MGIFQEEEKKMADEAAGKARGDAQREAELGQITRKVSEDLMSYIGAHAREHEVDIEVNENRVTLRKKKTSNTLDITCVGRDSFELAIDGGRPTATSKSNMARTTIDWLKG
jgi:hypothetical protein